MFCDAFKEKKGVTWLMKPVGRSQGSGIFFVTKLSQIREWKPAVYNDVHYSNSAGSAGGNTAERISNDKDNARDNDGDDPPEGYVIQQYIDSPYLVGGKKFDLRLYCLVTSYSPLEVWIYREGFARLCLTPYTNKKSEAHMKAHLTNVAVQKVGTNSQSAATSNTYKRTGGKWDVRRLRTFLVEKHREKQTNYA